MDDKCLRCKNKEVNITCINCDSFKFLCTQCDSYVHSLPSKKKHTRVQFTVDISPVEEKKQEEKELAESQWDYKFKLSSTNKIPNLNYDDQDKDQEEKTKRLNDYKYNPIIKSYASDLNALSEINFNPPKNHTGSSFLNSPIAAFPNYSKEYLNELKGIYEKEKTELLFKNSTLQNNLDRLKLNLSEQINQLNSEIDDINKKHTNNLSHIQDASEKKMKSILYEKDCKIERLSDRINDLEKINEELRNKLNDSSKENLNLKNSYGKENLELKQELNHIEKDFHKYRSESEKKISSCESMNKEDNKRLIYDYENKIEKMINQFEDMREKMSAMIKDRENDIKIIIDRHRNEIATYQEEVANLKEEIECHKKNILAIKSKKDHFESELSRMAESLDGFKRETKYQSVELRSLDEQNQNLLKENENLKIQISRLDKLVYGKIRVPSFKK